MSQGIRSLLRTIQQRGGSFGGVQGRKIQLALDADASSNPGVRKAEIRLWFLLRAAGAEVFRLTSWDEREGKGIDDYLLNATKEDPHQTHEGIVQILTSPHASSQNEASDPSITLFAQCEAIHGASLA